MCFRRGIRLSFFSALDAILRLVPFDLRLLAALLRRSTPPRCTRARVGCLSWSCFDFSHVNCRTRLLRLEPPRDVPDGEERYKSLVWFAVEILSPGFPSLTLSNSRV